MARGINLRKREMPAVGKVVPQFRPEIRVGDRDERLTALAWKAGDELPAAIVVAELADTDEAAIARDPRFAAAYTGLADSYGTWGFYGGVPTLEASAKVRSVDALSTTTMRVGTVLARTLAVLAG